VPVLGPPLSPTDTLSTDPLSFSFLTDPPDRSFPEKYLIVSTIQFGRISNARILVGDMAGLGIVLNRTVILPHLNACGNEGHDGVWDLDALRVPGILSGIGLDVQRLSALRAQVTASMMLILHTDSPKQYPYLWLFLWPQ
jgi:hypothetical protein